MMEPAQATLILGIVVWLILLVLFVYLMEIIKPSKTRLYRRDLADMYVSGKIRKLATKDGINIADELKEFVRFTKHQKKFMESLDNAIETEMKDNLEEDIRDSTVIEFNSK